MTRQEIARGSANGDGMKTIAIRFPPDAFATIRAEAIKNDIPFAEQVRRYVNQSLVANKPKGKSNDSDRRGGADEALPGKLRSPAVQS